MKDKIQKCKKCQKTYTFSSTGCDLCVVCIEKYPYFLSFVEEGFDGVTDRIFGRVEVYTNKEPEEYAIDELRFLFKENKLKSKEFYKFRERWDFQNVTKRKFEEIKKKIKDDFYDDNQIES